MEDAIAEEAPARLVPEGFDFDLFLKGAMTALQAIMTTNAGMTVGIGSTAAIDNAVSIGLAFERKVSPYKAATRRGGKS